MTKNEFLNTRQLTDEILAEIQVKPYFPPTLFVEGAEDATIFREIRDRLEGGFDIINCNGRNKLLEVWKEVSQKKKNRKKFLFIADKDFWVFEDGVPEDYRNQPNLIFTTGYCIENDLYADGKAVLDTLFTPHELKNIHKSIERIAHWFVSELEKPETDRRLSDKHITFQNGTFFSVTDCDFVNQTFTTPDDETMNRHGLNEHYPLRLRGKYFFQLYAAFSQKIKPLNVTFTDKQLQYLCLCVGYQTKDSYTGRLVEHINSFFILKSTMDQG